VVRKVETEDEIGFSRAAGCGILPSWTLTPDEAFHAFCGLGLPDEIGYSAEVVESLLLSSRVVKVGTRCSPAGSVLLDTIELENGLKIYLVSNAHGAGVLKIRRVDGKRPVDDVQLGLFSGTGDVSL
jgi:hypothetical protein